MEGGRLVALLVLIVLMSETGLHLYSQLGQMSLGPLSQEEEPQPQPQPGDKKEVLSTITSFCLPKLVCQLFSLENTDTLSDSERNLISLIG